MKVEENKNENPDLLEDEKRDMENQEEEKYEIPEKANYEEEMLQLKKNWNVWMITTKTILLQPLNFWILRRDGNYIPCLE